MRTNIAKHLFLVVFIGFQAFAFAQINLNNGLIGFFDLDNNVLDRSSVSIDGVASNLTSAIGKNNNLNGALNFNGVNSNVDCTSDNRGVTDVITISAWVKTTSLNYQWVVGKYDWHVDRGYHLAMNNGHPVLAGRNMSGAYVSTNHPNPSIFINDGNWHFLVGEISGNTWTLWIDCVLDNSVTSTAATPSLVNSEPLAIGYYVLGGNGGVNHNYFDGDIDEVRLYNRTLTVDERTLICDINYIDPVLAMPIVSNDTLVCDSTMLTLTAIPDSGLVFWESPRGTIIDTGNAISIMITQDTLFYVYSVLNGIVSDTAVINVTTKTCNSSSIYPSISFSDRALCEGESLQFIAFPDSGTVHWESPFGTNIFIGDTLNILVTQTQQYYVYVQYLTGVSDTTTFTVTMKNCTTTIYLPIAPNDTLVCKNSEVIFQAFRDTGTVYWIDEQGIVLDSGTSVAITVSADTRVVLYNEVSGQRSDTVSFFITVTECGDEIFPNVFTPNGDGINDYFYFTIPNTTCFNGRIYNRWGVVVHEMPDIEFGWNGVIQYSGEPVADGVYYYEITYCVNGGSEKTKTGAFSLIR